MNSLAITEREPAASKVEVTDEELIISLIDGRRISAPLVWYPRLLHGTPKERNSYELIGRGTGVHWPALDEDLPVAGILRGNPSFESEKSLRQWLESRPKQKRR